MKKATILILMFLWILSCKTEGQNKETVIVKDTTEEKQTVPQEESSLQETQKTPREILIGDFIDVEKLNQDVDLSMDTSKLSLAEVRVLRNSFAAKQGYCFMKSDLRGLYSTTTWYDEVMNDRFWKEEAREAVSPISYTVEEKGFIKKLKEREQALRKENFTSNIDQHRVNLKNIVNIFQMEETPQVLMDMLGENGFAIVPNTNIQLFHVYEKNDYHEFPSFVTTDMYMQLFHMYFGYILRTIEEEQFIPLLEELSEGMQNEMLYISDSEASSEIKQLADYNRVYYAIAYSVLTTKKVEVPEGYQKWYDDELQAIEKAMDATSDFLDYKQISFPYSLFKPRGHYTRTEPLKRYFKAMMWLQTAPFCLDSSTKLKSAILSAEALRTTPRLLKKYKAIMEPIDFIIGQPDNISFFDLVKVLSDQNQNVGDLMNNKDAFNVFASSIKEIANTKNKIGPKAPTSCPDKINFIPQRYLSDNEVLQSMVDLENDISKRAYPKGLDVMAAFGSATAENILVNELKEQEQWQKYPEVLSKMKAKMSSVDWDATLYNKWIHSLLELQKKKEEYPYFMQTSQWDKKNMNASLASWAELKHDAILYAEQPMAAECGDGGPPDPYTVGYVEPNINYWNAVIELLNLTKQVLQDNELWNKNVSGITNSLTENAQFLLSASKKELAGNKLSQNEYKQIEIIGSTFEWLTLDLVSREGEYLDGWHNVKGPDKSVAVVADIYTANSQNNPDRGILHVATGNVNDIYVVVEIEGYLYLTKGAVFGYHEFHLPMGNRLTDEEWQDMLEKNEAPGVPIWIKEIIAPIQAPKTNERIFYSSGC